VRQERDPGERGLSFVISLPEAGGEELMRNLPGFSLNRHSGARGQIIMPSDNQYAPKGAGISYTAKDTFGLHQLPLLKERAGVTWIGHFNLSSKLFLVDHIQSKG
jgi:hypothetical protein